MLNQKIVSKDEWLEARKNLLKDEKEFTRLRDRLSQQRRDLPWVRVDKEYSFEGPKGMQALSDLFDGRSQLIVYHFMYGPDWEDACPSCSFWADNFNGIDIHLRHRDTSLVAVSRARLEQLQAYQKRMGWNFKWLSSHDSDFNYDYQASFTPEELEKGEMLYNFKVGQFPADEAPDISVFYRNEGAIYSIPTPAMRVAWICSMAPIIT